jgi:hypothetical protein
MIHDLTNPKIVLYNGDDVVTAAQGSYDDANQTITLWDNVAVVGTLTPGDTYYADSKLSLSELVKVTYANPDPVTGNLIFLVA